MDPSPKGYMEQGWHSFERASRTLMRISLKKVIINSSSIRGGSTQNFLKDTGDRNSKIGMWRKLDISNIRNSSNTILTNSKTTSEVHSPLSTTTISLTQNTRNSIKASLLSGRSNHNKSHPHKTNFVSNNEKILKWLTQKFKAARSILMSEKVWRPLSFLRKKLLIYLMSEE